MRITTLLIGIQACFVTLLFAGTSKAQTLNLDIQQANVKQVFTSIEQQANVTFVYNEKTIHRLGKISLNEKNKSLQDVLKDISAKLPLVFKKAGNVIGVSYKGPDTNSPVPTLGVPPPLVTTGAKDLPPGLKDISGIVTDTSGVPIYGVTVRIKGMKIITSTDAKGYFFLRQIPENSVIIVSYVGFNSQEIDLTNNSSKSFNIILHSNSSQLKEVSVSTGYQELPLERATGSFAQVDNALYNREVSTDVISRLKGIVSGLNFDNTAGNSLGISIRGRSTLLSNTQPLIILDNFPYEGDINNINPMMLKV